MLTTPRIWKLADGGCEQILQGHTGRVNSIKLCDTNHTAVTVSDDFTARVWDWSTGECRHVLEGHGGWLSDMALLPNATRAVTVSGDDLAVVWDLEEGKCCNVLEGHSGETSSVVLTRRGRFVTVLLAHCASHSRLYSFLYTPCRLNISHSAAATWHISFLHLPQTSRMQRQLVKWDVRLNQHLWLLC